jgi:hypothetical protein
MISILENSLESSPSPDSHDWWVMEALPGSPGCLLVFCKITKLSGAVWDFTPDEFAAAAGPTGWKYQLDDASRVEVRTM